MFRRAVHPGEILKDELDELGVSPTAFARTIDVPPNRISQIIAGKRSVTGDTALRLGHWFRHGPPVLAEPPVAVRPRCRGFVTPAPYAVAPCPRTLSSTAQRPARPCSARGKRQRANLSGNERISSGNERFCAVSIGCRRGRTQR